MSEPVLHFGLGTLPAVRELRIERPSGAVDVHWKLAAGGRYVATEGGDIVPEKTARPPWDVPLTLDGREIFL